jgi:hypothetical protein
MRINPKTLKPVLADWLRFLPIKEQGSFSQNSTGTPTCVNDGFEVPNGATVDVYINGFNLMAELRVCNLRLAAALVPGSFKATIATRLKGYE